MSTKFNMTRDINGYNGFGILPTYDIQSTSLADSVAQSITVPSNFQNWIAIITYSPGSSIFVDFTGVDAAAPSTAFASATASLNPSARQVSAGQSISFITTDADSPYVCVEFQAILPYTINSVQ
jgi:hypothetical protein